MMCFAMPFGGVLEIRPSKELEEEPEMDEEVDGVVYNIFWNDKLLPWYTNTRLDATKIAMGCQWGAFEILK